MVGPILRNAGMMQFAFGSLARISVGNPVQFSEPISRENGGRRLTDYDGMTADDDKQHEIITAPDPAREREL